ncbi:MAG: hypothetical protein J6M53_03375 [Bacteroidaceae bacterium]|nr:hypothetical protein [Bacteroidaceae bacterium]
MKRAFFFVLAATALSFAGCNGKTDGSQAATDTLGTDTITANDTVKIDPETGDTIYEEDAPNGVATSKDDAEIAAPPAR